MSLGDNGRQKKKFLYFKFGVESRFLDIAFVAKLILFSYMRNHFFTHRLRRPLSKREIAVQIAKHLFFFVVLEAFFFAREQKRVWSIQLGVFPFLLLSGSFRVRVRGLYFYVVHMYDSKETECYYES